VKLGREGSTVPFQLCGGLRRPNMTVSPTGSTTIRMVGDAVCIDNAPGTSSLAMSKTFPCRHRDVASEGSTQSPH
jgi:hypothetical protein